MCLLVDGINDALSSVLLHLQPPSLPPPSSAGQINKSGYVETAATPTNNAINNTFDPIKYCFNNTLAIKHKACNNIHCQ